MIKMKETHIDWIKEIPSTWDIVPLKTIAAFYKGLPITKADLTESGIPVVSYGQIHSKENSGTKLKQELVRYVPEDFLYSNASSLGQYGDLFFADTSEDYDGVGNAVFIDTTDKTFAGYHTIIVRPTIEGNLKYFAYLCLSETWRKQLRSNAAGIKVYSVTQNMLKKVSVLVPPLEDQQKIVEFLDKKCIQVDLLISNVTKQIESLKTYNTIM